MWKSDDSMCIQDDNRDDAMLGFASPKESPSCASIHTDTHQISKWDMLHQLTYVSSINYSLQISGKKTPANKPWKQPASE